jgi:hypothetical protein
MIYFALRGRSLGLAILMAVSLFFVLAERLAPGNLATIGTAIGGIDKMNTAGPHLQIDPWSTFRSRLCLIAVGPLPDSKPKRRLRVHSRAVTADSGPVLVPAR